MTCKWETTSTAQTIPFFPNTARQEVSGRCVGVAGPIADKIRTYAAQMKPSGADAAIRAEGIADSFEELVLKISKQESGFRHCCIESGKNKAKSCKSSEDASCEAGRVLTSFDGSSIGAMQINVHSDQKNYIASVITKYTIAGCDASNGPYNMDCNIKIGIGILLDKYGNGGTQNICDSSFSGWSLALRKYVGTGCNDYARKYVNAVKNQVIDSSSSTTSTSKQYNQYYCATKPGGCLKGEGGCENDGECQPTDSKNNPLKCMAVDDGITRMDICCPSNYVDYECLDAYNNWAKNKKS
jgi:hypothetical protein